MPKAKTQFGAKFNLNLLNAYSRVDIFDWGVLNERQDLQAQVERFRKLSVKYPLHREATGSKTGKGEKEQIPET